MLTATDSPSARATAGLAVGGGARAAGGRQLRGRGGVVLALLAGGRAADRAFHRLPAHGGRQPGRAGRSPAPGWHLAARSGPLLSARLVGARPASGVAERPNAAAVQNAHAATKRNGQAVSLHGIVLSQGAIARRRRAPTDHHAGARGSGGALRRADRLQEREDQRAEAGGGAAGRADPYLSQSQRAGRQRRPRADDPRRRTGERPRHHAAPGRFSPGPQSGAWPRVGDHLGAGRPGGGQQRAGRARSSCSS